MCKLRLLLHTTLQLVKPITLACLFSRGFLGHAQTEHETSHGSMSQTRWAVDGPDGEVVELNGHRFSAEDEGAPMLVRSNT
jgi:hypothetical protein